MHGAEKAPGASGIPAAPGMAAATPNTPDASPRLEPALLRPSRRRVWAAAHHLPATLQQLEPRLLMAADVVYALNAGGPGFTDGNGVVWVADAGFANPNAGNFTASTAQPINLSDPSVPAGTDAQLFQTERWDPSSGEDLTYSLAVDNGDYEVDLYFADIFSGTQGVGERVFDIVLEGQTVADDFDVVAAAGGGFTGIVETYSVAVSDGTIDLQFLHEVENPALKAILVRSVAVDPVDPPTPNVIAPYIDLNGFLPGIDTDTTFVVGQGPINVTPPDAGLADGDTDVVSLTVTVVGNPDGANETLDADLTGTNLTKAYANGVLTISGVAAFEVYQDVLRTITYDNTASPADGSTRTLALAASDGEL
ncbi:MAG: malectin, partial [Planctomycetota bacterium]